MRQVEISEGVAARLGAEQVARLTGPEWAGQRVQCWECDGWAEPDEPVAVLVLQQPGSTLEFAVHAHHECAPSEVRTLTEQERAARAAAQQQAPAEDGTEVDAEATVWDTGRGSAWPVVLVSYRQEVMIGDGPERRDGLVAMMTSWGWHPVFGLTSPPQSGPEGWRCRFTHESSATAAPGLLELVEPSGQAVTAAHVQPHRLWRPAVVHTGRTAVLHGSRFLDQWATRGRSAVKAAARQGSLVGGVLPCELHGPGNT